MRFRIVLPRARALTLNQRIMATAIIRKGNKYLLLRRAGKLAGGRWQFPEGGVKFGEDPLAALRRELAEETGLRLRSARLLGFDSHIIRALRTDLYHIIRVLYAVQAAGSPRLSGEHDRAGWFTKAQIGQLLLFEMRWPRIRRLLK